MTAHISLHSIPLEKQEQHRLKAPSLSLGFPRGVWSQLDITGWMEGYRAATGSWNTKRWVFFLKNIARRLQAEAQGPCPSEAWAGAGSPHFPGTLSPSFTSAFSHQGWACTVENKCASQSKLHQAVNTAIAIYHSNNEPTEAPLGLWLGCRALNIYFV